MRDFRKYDIWKLSHELTLNVYHLTDDFPKSKIYGIVSQLRRATSSMPTNISEGCGRDSDAEFNRFLTIAVGSASEVEYLLILSNDLGYMNQEVYQKLNETINLIKRKIYSLKQKLNQQNSL